MSERVEELLQALASAERSMLTVEARRVWLLERQTERRVPDRDAADCANQYGCPDPAVKAGRCEPCYRYRHSHGTDAPPSVLARRREGRRCQEHVRPRRFPHSPAA